MYCWVGELGIMNSENKMEAEPSTNNDIQHIYSISDLKNYTDQEWLAIVKQAWGYVEGQPFKVLGRLKEVKRENGNLYWLKDLHSINDGRSLFYPLGDITDENTVYVGSLHKKKLINDKTDEGGIDNRWVTAQVELSNEVERLRHRNPMELKVIYGSCQILHEIPEKVLETELLIDGKPQIENWVVDVYREKNRSAIIKDDEELKASLKIELAAIESETRKSMEEEKNKLQNEIVDTEQRISAIKYVNLGLLEKIDEINKEERIKSESLKKLTEDLTELKQIKELSEVKYIRDKSNMENHLNTLNQFIEDKAKMLLELDLVSQNEVGVLTGKVKEEKEKGHDFSEIFGSDLNKAIAYIQAFMKKKGIVYRRNVLEDFFSLLTTHDLIILAGDSGSGKTNLVKSFAEAIGGKSIIVPVKPNWTSAEDLLGYYNPLEQKYLSTPFLEALFEAAKNPNIPYFICLDEMNLARVEYYFADFLSLLEERGQAPEFQLYSDSESSHLVSEIKNFLSLVDESKEKLKKTDLVGFLDLLRDVEVNAKLHELCGFKEGDSLLKYHAQLRRLLGNYINTPSSIRLPPNVRIIGAINVDETTHYLSPKILDRAHIVRFGNPLLTDWDKAEGEVEDFDLDLTLPVYFDLATLGNRVQYPDFDRSDNLVVTLIHIVKEYLEPLGVEFGLRTVRQARHYSAALQEFNANSDLILNNIVLHKILPKLMFDGEKAVNDTISRKDILKTMRDYLAKRLVNLHSIDVNDSCIAELDRVIRNAEANDWVVNYWSR